MRRISKQRERIKIILSILDKEKATFETLLAEVKCGRATLSDDLKFLVRRGVIKKYEDSEDSRRKWYEKIVVGPDDRVKAEKGKYASIDFIENLDVPIYGFKASPNGKHTVSVFISPVEGHLRELAQKKVNKLVGRIGLSALRMVARGVLRPGRKIAVILTMEG